MTSAFADVIRYHDDKNNILAGQVRLGQKAITSANAQFVQDILRHRVTGLYHEWTCDEGQVLLTGNQSVSGVKTFEDNAIFESNLNVSGTSTFQDLYLSGSSYFENITVEDWIDINFTDVSKGAGLIVSNLNISTNAGLNGIYSYHVKTAGTTDQSDSFNGILSKFDFNDPDSTASRIVGIDSRGRISSGTTEGIYGALVVGEAYGGTSTRDIQGILTEAQINGSNVSGDVYGVRCSVDFNTGEVADDVFGINVNVDLESTITRIGGDVYGIRIWVDDDIGAQGPTYMLYLDEASNIDYGIYQNGTAPNRFGGVTTLTSNVYVSGTTTINNKTTLLNNLEVVGDSGFGESSPDGKVHIKDGSAGSITASTEVDDLIIENSGDVGVQFRCPATNVTRIGFASPDGTPGFIKYDHTLQTLSIVASGNGGIDLEQTVVTLGFAGGNTQTLIFRATVSTGSIVWNGTNGYFTFEDDILMNSTERIYFNDTNSYIYDDGTNIRIGTNGSLHIEENVIIGNGGAGVDPIITMSGDTYTGYITWDEGNDYFRFNDDILMSSNERIYLNDTNSYIYDNGTNLLLGTNGSVVSETNFIIGDGTPLTNFSLTFDGQTEDGVITWLESDGRFRFDNHILMNSTERIYFNDTSSYIYDNGTNLIVSTNGNTLINSDLMVGSTDAPDGTLHVWTGDAGSITVTTAVDDLIIENNGDVGMEFRCPDDDIVRIFFTTPSRVSGSITYNHSTSGLALACGGNRNHGLEVTSAMTELGFAVNPTETLKFRTSDTQGSLSWTGTNNYFTFHDDIMMESTERIYFNDTGHFIYQAGGNFNFGTTGYFSFAGQMYVSGNLGIGETSPEGKVHIKSTDAGSFTAVTAADDLIIENNGDVGIQFRCPTTNTVRIIFSSPATVNPGYFKYDHGVSALSIVADVNNSIGLSRGQLSFAVQTSANTLKFITSGANDGYLYWDGDDDRFIFQDDIMMESTERIYFGDTDSYIYDDGSNLLISSNGNVKLTSLLLATGTSVNDIAAEGSPTDSDNSLWTGANIVNYVAGVIPGGVLSFTGDIGPGGSVVLGSQTFSISGIDDEIETSAGNQTILIGLPNDVTIGNDLTVTTDAIVGGTLGIGDTSLLPAGTVHIKTAYAGSITASTATDDLIIENNGDVGMQFRCPDNDVVRVGFSTPTNTLGYFSYDHSTDTFSLVASGNGGITMTQTDIALGYAASNTQTLTFRTKNDSGVFGWTGADDRFTFQDDIMMESTERIYFGDTGHFIYQAGGNFNFGTTGYFSFAGQMYVSGNLGIGETSPEGKVHIKSTDAGSFTAVTAADDLIIENNGDVGMEFRCPDNDIVRIFFSTPSRVSGSITYNHSTSGLALACGGNRNHGLEVTSAMTELGFAVNPTETLKFRTSDTQGSLSWTGADGRFTFHDDIMMESTERIYFNDTDSYIYDDGSKLNLISSKINMLSGSSSPFTYLSADGNTLNLNCNYESGANPQRIIQLFNDNGNTENSSQLRMKFRRTSTNTSELVVSSTANVATDNVHFAGVNDFVFGDDDPQTDDVNFFFRGSNVGEFRWAEDEDYFVYFDDVLFSGDSKLIINNMETSLFWDTNSGLNLHTTSAIILSANDSVTATDDIYMKLDEDAFTFKGYNFYVDVEQFIITADANVYFYLENSGFYMYGCSDCIMQTEDVDLFASLETTIRTPSFYVSAGDFDISASTNGVRLYYDNDTKIELYDTGFPGIEIFGEYGVDIKSSTGTITLESYLINISSDYCEFLLSNDTITWQAEDTISAYSQTNITQADNIILSSTSTDGGTGQDYSIELLSPQSPDIGGNHASISVSGWNDTYGGSSIRMQAEQYRLLSDNYIELSALGNVNMYCDYDFTINGENVNLVGDRGISGVGVAGKDFFINSTYVVVNGLSGITSADFDLSQVSTLNIQKGIIVGYT